MAILCCSETLKTRKSHGRENAFFRSGRVSEHSCEILKLSEHRLLGERILSRLET